MREKIILGWILSSSNGSILYKSIYSNKNHLKIYYIQFVRLSVLAKLNIGQNENLNTYTFRFILSYISIRAYIKTKESTNENHIIPGLISVPYDHP